MTYPDPQQNPYGQSPYGGQQPYGAPQGNPYAPPGAPYYGGPGSAPPSNNIGWAIAAIFLFWPLAIPAFIASGKVDDFWRRGDVAGAQQASADAKKWGSLGVWIGIGLYVLSCVLACLIPTVLGVGVCGLGAVGAGTSESG